MQSQKLEKKKMINAKLIFCILAPCMFFGCAHIPRSKQPLEVHESVNASFENTWNAGVVTVGDLKGTVFAKDKTAGLITCKIPGRKRESAQYVNIFVKTDSQNLCDVYIVPHAFSTYTRYNFPYRSKEKIIFIFEDIYSGKDHLSNVGSAFFEKLEVNLRGRRL